MSEIIPLPKYAEENYVGIYKDIFCLKCGEPVKQFSASYPYECKKESGTIVVCKRGLCTKCGRDFKIDKYGDIQPKTSLTTRKRRTQRK